MIGLIKWRNDRYLNARVSRTIRIIPGAKHDSRSATVIHERSRTHNKRGRAEEHIPAEHAEQR